jgi:hypothetical protein
MSGIRRAITKAQQPDIAARELFLALRQPACCLVLLFVSPDYDMPALAHALAAQFGDVPFAGCTTSGEIGPGGYTENSIVGFSLSGPHFAASIGLIRNLSQMNAADMQATVRQTRLAIYDGAPWARHENLFAITLIDGLCRCEELVVSAACGALAGIPLRGGSAGDGLHFQRTFVLHEGAFRSDCALIVVVATRRRFRAFKTEHFTAGREKSVVTGADPRRRVVTEINAEPAAREYARITGRTLQDLTPATFATHPMVVRVGEQCFVRSIHRVNPDLSLTFLCAIDEGVVLTVGQAGDLIGTLQQSLSDIEQDIGPPELVIAFDCILRRLELDQRRIRPEVGRLMDRNNAVGFSTYGEQYEAMHMNQTLSGIAIGAENA